VSQAEVVVVQRERDRGERQAQLGHVGSGIIIEAVVGA
jgi:hypothetical protein